MTTVGYARVSSTGQDLEVQLEKLKGCEKVFKEKRSGLDAGRPELKRCLEYLREGEAGKPAPQVINIMAALKEEHGDQGTDQGARRSPSPSSHIAARARGILPHSTRSPPTQNTWI